MENSEKLFQLIMEHTHSWEYLLGPDLRLLYVSPSCERYTGYPPQAFLDDQHQLFELIHPEDKDLFLNHLSHEECAPFPHKMNFRIIDTSNKIRWFSHMCQPLFDENKEFIGRRASNHEITDYKEEVQRREELTQELRETTALLNTVLDAIPDVIGVQDQHHNIIRYNKAGYDYLGKQYCDVVGKKCYSLIGHDTPCKICATSEVYTTKQTARREKFIPELNNWLDMRAYPVLDDDGNLVKVIEHLRDISREKTSEAQLKDAHERLITILDGIEAHIYVADLATNIIIFMNHKMKCDFNADFVGKCCHESLRNEPNTCEHCTNDKILDENGQPTGIITWESFNPVTNCWYMNYDRAIQWVNGRMVKLQIATDITDSKNKEKLRHKMEKQLQQAQKLEAIGTLAGGVAHDFNNLLTGILGQSSLMTYELNPTHPCRKRLDDIIAYTQKATELTSQLLGLAKGGKYEAQPIDINEVLIESSSMFGRTKKELSLHIKLTEPPPIVGADRRQIEQVLLNIYINAWQAMIEGGNIYLETQVVERNGNNISAPNSSGERFVKISITDSGIGMDKKVMERIFDPFFTTKETGRGTGLGLASAYGIIKNHHGFIEVDSSVGKGSTFNIYLPLSQQQPKAVISIRDSLRRGQECILLVDDEEMVRKVGRDMLANLGYHVIIADRGEHAIDLVKDNFSKFDLVILDMIMPGINGGKTFDAIHEFAPYLPVILASGYSIDGKAEEILRKGGKAFIQKPFDFLTLSNTIRSVLDES